jgi:DNA-binding GntR family transcriptional regulator
MKEIETVNAVEKISLSDKVTLLLRENIVSGTLSAGSPLKQEELSERFGVSMGSLREALRTLNSEGLVTLLPNRGAAVSELSASEAEEIFDIRTYLELGALELALPHAAERIFGAAEKVLDKMDAVGDASKWADLNRKFHETLYAPANRPRLMGLIRNMHDNVGRYMRLYLDTLNFQSESQREHRDLLAACRERDLSAAQRILREHTRHAREQLVRYLESSKRSRTDTVQGKRGMLVQ